MQPRVIVRPRDILSTPRSLAEGLSCRTRRINHRTNRKYSYTHDFLLTYPPLSLMDEETHALSNRYNLLRRFAASDKPSQRYALALPCPTTRSRGVLQGPSQSTICPNGYIVRPLRHSRGIDYRHTQDPEDYSPETEYISEVFPKSHEYRVITVFGKIACILRKRPPENALPHEAWNHHQGSSFQTVEAERCNLIHTSCLTDILSNPIIQLAHLTGIDILLAKNPWRYVFCEVNFCPALTIPDNLTKVIQHVQDAN